MPLWRVTSGEYAGRAGIQALVRGSSACGRLRAKRRLPRTRAFEFCILNHSTISADALPALIWYAVTLILAPASAFTIQLSFFFAGALFEVLIFP